MKKLSFEIIKILSSVEKYFTRQEIEEKLQRVSKRTVLNEISEWYRV